jgi:hypothetical protein
MRSIKVDEMGSIKICYEHACEDIPNIMLLMINWNWTFKKMPCTYTIKFKEGETLMVLSIYVQDKCIFPHMAFWENIVGLVICIIGSSFFVGRWLIEIS